MTASILPFARFAGVERFQSVAAEEAVLVAQTEAQRLVVVERYAPKIFGMRSELNRVDDVLADRADSYARLLHRCGGIGNVAWIPPFAPWIYWTAMLVMVILEIPVNAAAIDLLRLPVAESHMFATFVALANLVAAKFTARAVRQWDVDQAPARSLAIAAIANAALLAGLLALAWMRADAVAGVGSPLAFLALQLMFYTVALLASYFQTPPSAETEQDSAQLRRAEHQLRQTWKERARLARYHNIALARIQSKVRRLEHDCARRIAHCRSRCWAGSPDAEPLEPITQANFQPLELGEPVDHHPVCIDAVVAAHRLS